MFLLRALVGSLLWILAGVLGLVGVVLCVTVILLPVGIPVLMLARKLFSYSMVFFLPRKARHPVQELGKAVSDRVDDAKSSASDVDLKPAKKKARKARRKSKSFVKDQRKRLA